MSLLNLSYPRTFSLEESVIAEISTLIEKVYAIYDGEVDISYNLKTDELTDLEEGLFDDDEQLKSILKAILHIIEEVHQEFHIIAIDLQIDQIASIEEQTATHLWHQDPDEHFLFLALGDIANIEVLHGEIDLQDDIDPSSNLAITNKAAHTLEIPNGQMVEVTPEQIHRRGNHSSTGKRSTLKLYLQNKP